MNGREYQEPPASDAALRIGILTFHFVPNYGAVWQTFALQQTLQGLGHDAEVLDYRPRHVNGGGRLRWPTSRGNVRADLVSLYQRYLRVLARFGRRRELEEAFEQFRERFFKRSSGVAFNGSQLRVIMAPLNAVVCGSDQIWNPSEQHGLDPAYFGAAAPPTCRRVAYAASFGRGDVEDRWLREVGQHAEQMHAISTREASGSAILQRAGFRRSVPHLPDPTLLLPPSLYPQEAPPERIPNRYLFSYVLRSREGVVGVRDRVAERMGLPVVASLNPHAGRGEVDPAATVCLPSPTQWLQLIRGAEAVVTNSYHGTLFSVIFERPFLVVGIGSGKSSLNERAKSLLERLGLEGRFLTADSSPEEAADRLKAPIDFDAVRAEVLKWRGEALDFLRTETTRPTRDTADA